MKLVRIEIFELAAPLERPFRWATGTAYERRTTLVRAIAESGAEGWGETIRGSIDGAIEIATCDAAAREAGVPLAAMLAPEPARAVDVYASGIYYDGGDAAEEARRYLAAGFPRVKMKIGGASAGEDLARVRAVRDALGDAELMVDANGAYGFDEAVAMAGALRELGVRWLEEPFPLRDRAAYRRLHALGRIPVAAGESLDAAALETLLDVVHVVQPNVATCGGAASACALLRRAAAKGVRPAIHAWGTPVMTAVSLHVAAACAGAIVEIDRTPNPLRDVAPDFDVHAGAISIPARAGLGIDVDLDAVKSYRVRSIA